ncbi:MAG TPA: hypothetical protein VGQ32_07995 [Thermoanaerobaculia bacterium]|nr:hypothetical protein [Thermoanaerobaculia bacterium]
MSAESSSFEADYIRRTERFKALSTFEQFLSGIRRGFLPIQGGVDYELGQLYNEIKRGPSLGEAALAKLDEKLDAAAERLRAADIPMSPSLTRRYFEKVRPSDGRIPFYLLRFYLWQPESDESLLDKVDYLATVVAAGTPDPASPATRPREETRKIFDRLLADSSWPQIDGEAAPELARAFDEVSAQIASARNFEELGGGGHIESLRNLKRQLSRGVGHPEILTAAATCNLTARSVFRRLYEKEERGLRDVTRRIEDLERRVPQHEIRDAELLHRFRDSRRELDRQASEGTVRWRQIVEVQHAAADALRMLTGAEPEEAAGPGEAAAGGEPSLDEANNGFWGPCLKRILSAVEAGDQVRSVQGWRALEECRLDEWEAAAARRAIARKTLARPERVILFAAALRVKAEAETEATRRCNLGGVPPDLAAAARATLAHASELDRTFAGFAVIEGGDAAEEVRRWTRTRLRLLHATSALWLALDIR